MLVDGRWTTRWYEPDKKGHFVRPATVFRDQLSAAGDITAGRYHVYIARACPWAHRVALVRELRGLQDAIGLTVVDPLMGDDGWVFSDAAGCQPDPLYGFTRVHELYTRADPTYTGRVTVPILWDKERATIVNNESREIIRMLDTVFTPLATRPEVVFWTPDQSDEIDAAIDAIYEPINNGVYRAGFARSQAAYDESVTRLFEALDHVDNVLGTQRYLCGDRITEADWCLFTTLLRFDLVYYGHFKCNLRSIASYPHLSGYLRELAQLPGVAATTDLDHIKRHYYWSHDSINPTRIVPAGPAVDLTSPHGRG